MAVEWVDLHTHTTASDGMDSPATVVRLAKAAGLAAVAITDHDTIAGVDEAIQEGARIGITVVPGVELSTAFNGADIHILGYYAQRTTQWLERLASLRNVRGRRNEQIIANLQRLGIAITMENVKAQAQAQAQAQAKAQTCGETSANGVEPSVHKSIGRPHFAQALVACGAAASIGDAFERYLGSSGAAFAQVERISPFEAVDWIREAGGRSVIAHPGLYNNDQLVEELLEYGASGLEVYHSDHHEDDEQRYLEMAFRHQAIITGGSDYHGSREGQLFHGPIGGRAVNAAVLRVLAGVNPGGQAGT